MDDELILVDYKNLPIVVPVIDNDHPNVLSGEISGGIDKQSALHMYKNKTIHNFEVPDSREGCVHLLKEKDHFPQRHFSVYKSKKDILTLPKGGLPQIIRQNNSELNIEN